MRTLSRRSSPLFAIAMLTVLCIPSLSLAQIDLLASWCDPPNGEIPYFVNHKCQGLAPLVDAAAAVWNQQLMAQGSTYQLAARGINVQEACVPGGTDCIPNPQKAFRCEYTGGYLNSVDWCVELDSAQENVLKNGYHGAPPAGSEDSASVEALAVTHQRIESVDGRNCCLTGADICVMFAFGPPRCDLIPWHAGFGAPAAGDFDMLSVLIHEFGHYLGLGHSSGAGSANNVMHPMIAPGQMRRMLGPQDIAGLTTLYQGPGLPRYDWGTTPTEETSWSELKELFR